MFSLLHVFNQKLSIILHYSYPVQPTHKISSRQSLCDNKNTLSNNKSPNPTDTCFWYYHLCDIVTTASIIIVSFQDRYSRISRFIANTHEKNQTYKYQKSLSTQNYRIFYNSVTAFMTKKIILAISLERKLIVLSPTMHIELNLFQK